VVPTVVLQVRIAFAITSLITECATLDLSQLNRAAATAMRPRLFRQLVWALAATALMSTYALVVQAAEASTPPSECLRDELLVKFRPGADPEAVSARHGATITYFLSAIEVHVVAVPAGTAEQKIAAFQADPEVVYAEPNGTVRAAATSEGACEAGPQTQS
jgi:hypothetical protein